MNEELIIQMLNKIESTLEEMRGLIRRIEDQNISNRSELSAQSERIKSLQQELTEHKSDEKDYGKNTDRRITKLETDWKPLFLAVVVQLVLTLSAAAGIIIKTLYK